MFCVDYYAAYHKLVPDAMDIPDEYYKLIDPKKWERIEKDREKEKKRAAEERQMREEKKEEAVKGPAKANV